MPLLPPEALPLSEQAPRIKPPMPRITDECKRRITEELKQQSQLTIPQLMIRTGYSKSAVTRNLHALKADGCVGAEEIGITVWTLSESAHASL